jgi:hypothetical protein
VAEFGFPCGDIDEELPGAAFGFTEAAVAQVHKVPAVILDGLLKRDAPPSWDRTCNQLLLSQSSTSCLTLSFA